MSPDPMSTPPALREQGPRLMGPVIMTQWWRDIAFVHWRVAAEEILPFLPRGVWPDVFDGSAWVGLIPFRMVHASLGRGLPVPWLGSFWETNVRVYTVDGQGRRGVTFLSLEAQRLLVVLGARAAFNVPYYWARMRGSADPGQARYETTRRWPGRVGTRSVIGIAVGEPITPGALEIFLTARFGLHTSLLGVPLWIPNTHGPWPLHRATLTHLDDELVRAAGLPDLPGLSAPDSVLWSAGVRTAFGVPEPVRGVGASRHGVRRDPDDVGINQ